MRDIGKNIKDLRVRRKMTQDELAEKLFVTRQTVSNYETGKSRPDIDMLMQIAEVLGADIHDILYGLPSPPDRKAEYRRFAAAAGICLILWVFSGWLNSITHELYFQFHLSPRFLLYHIYYPFTYFITGWTIFQLLSLFTGLRPLQNLGGVWCRRILLLIVAVILVFILPYSISAAWGDIQYLIAKQNGQTAFTYSSGTQLTEFHGIIFNLVMKYPAVFGLLGAGLWLCRAPLKKT